MIPGTKMCFAELGNQVTCKICGGVAPVGSDFWAVDHTPDCPVPSMLNAQVSVTMAHTGYDRDNRSVEEHETETFSVVEFATEWAVRVALRIEKDREEHDPRLQDLHYTVEAPEGFAGEVDRAVTGGLEKYRHDKQETERAMESAAEKTRQLTACRRSLTDLAKIKDDLRPEAYVKRLGELRVKYANVYDEAVGG